jgi:phenylacetate-CoA ligase
MLSSIYLSLPWFLQNVALSYYGSKMYKERFSRNGSSDNNDYSPFLLPNDESFFVQEQRLRFLLEHCKKHVPYYRSILSRVETSRIKVEDIKSLVPVLTKQDVLNAADMFVSQHPDHNNLLKANTSGSSGTPLTVHYTQDARRHNYSYYESLLRHFGCHYRSRSTTFAGRILYKNPGCRPDRYDYSNNTQYLSTYFISDQTIDSYVASLNSWKPEFIDSYPSALEEISRLIAKKQLKVSFTPKFILTSSENLTDVARDLIASVFRAPIVDHYGCTEMAINAASIGSGFYIDPRFSVIELNHKFDASYEVIATGLVNLGMPLLRYKIGDLVEIDDPANPYFFKRLDGRVDDVIVTPEGRRIGRLDPVFKGVDGINAAQIIQHDISNIEVLIVRQKEKNSFDEEILIKNLQERTSNLIQIRITYVEDIQKSANGKFKSVVSKVNS